MHIHNLRELAEFDDKKFLPKVLMNSPEYRLVLLNLRAGQSVPEHANKNTVTVYAVTGHITFYENRQPFELLAGSVLFIDGGALHSLEAHEDSTLMVVAAGSTTAAAKPEAVKPEVANPEPPNPELDLRDVPRPRRHPLVFAKFDALTVGESFELVNDHDPIPLHGQMDAMRPKQAEWTYIERRPEMYRIRVRRVAPLSGPAIPAPVEPEKLLNLR